MHRKWVQAPGMFGLAYTRKPFVAHLLFQVSRCIGSASHKLVERLKWWSTNYSCLLGETAEALSVLLHSTQQPLHVVVSSIQEYGEYQSDIQQEESKVNTLASVGHILSCQKATAYSRFLSFTSQYDFWKCVSCCARIRRQLFAS